MKKNIYLSISIGLLLAVVCLFGLLISGKTGPNVQLPARIIRPFASFPYFKNRVVGLTPLSMEEIFKNDHQWVATLSAQHMRTLIATGDVIPARSVNYKSVQQNNFRWAFEKTADFLQKADLTFINLETPLLENCAPTMEGMIFCGNSLHSEGLQFAGVDVVSLANNHAGNHGANGIAETKNMLEGLGLGVTSDTAVYRDVRGLRFAFLGFNDIGAQEKGIAWAQEEDEMRERIAEAQSQADVVIVTYHWGTEYKSQPDKRQRILGQLAIDAGADLVIGNHPHWIQPIELYKGKLITYAHGNFIFDQEWSQKTKEGVVGKYTFFDTQLVDVEYFPVEIVNYGQPYFLQNQPKQMILDEMYIASQQLQGVQ